MKKVKSMEFDEQIDFPNLEVLELHSLHCGKIWNNQFEGRLHFCKLTRLILESCGNLKNLIPLSMSKSLVHLKNLEVSDWEVIEEVIGAHEEGRCNNIILPNLESLVLLNLPNLKRFCSGNSIECPSLLKLKIENCCQLRTFISNISPDKEHEAVNLLPKLPLFNDKVIFYSVIFPFSNPSFLFGPHFQKVHFWLCLHFFFFCILVT